MLTTDGSGNLSYTTVDLTTLSASNLTSGTIPDARFPATLPAVSGANLTNVDAATLNGVTATTSELNILDGVTATTAELNILDGVTSTAAELNILDGVTATTAELNILDGVTATTAELNYVDGVTSNIQTQIDNINTDLSNDTSPQLGGVLDANGNNILMGNQSVKFGTSKWEIVLDTGDNDLLFKYNGTTVFKLASSGAVVSADNVTAYGTP